MTHKFKVGQKVGFVDGFNINRPGYSYAIICSLCEECDTCSCNDVTLHDANGICIGVKWGLALHSLIPFEFIGLKQSKRHKLTSIFK